MKLLSVNEKGLGKPALPKKLILLLVFIAVLSMAASAQLLVSVEEKTVCGDGKREGHEMCEPETEQDLCEAAGKILGIAMVCDERDCMCLPKRMDCGNGIREGSEWCDNPGDKEPAEENDRCPAFGKQLFNETFKCDVDSCLCIPEKIHGFTPSVCGDGNVTNAEQCEKDSDCRADQKCENCTCVIDKRNTTAIVEQVKKNLTKKPEIKEEPKEEKKTGYHDFVGALLPDYLKDDFDEAKVNVYVQLKNGSMQVVGVITMHGVVQEIKDEKLSGVGYDVFVEEQKARGIIDSDDRGAALKKAFDDGDITYRHKGLFSRIWAWIAGLFS